MQAGVCVAVVIMILLMATIIWLSVHGKTSTLPPQPKSIKETGGGWGGDVCKCNGNVSMIYWQGASSQIVYCKVGYVKFGMAGGSKIEGYENWGTASGDTHTFDNSCAEFYHGNILKAFNNAPPDRRRCKDWVFCNIPNNLRVQFGGSIHAIPASDFRIGVAGCAEIFARAYVLARIIQMCPNDIVSIRFASNGEDKNKKTENKKIENIPDDIPESKWAYIKRPEIERFSPWGNKTGEVFEFNFKTPGKDYTILFRTILNTLDGIFEKWGTALDTVFLSDIQLTTPSRSLMVIKSDNSELITLPICNTIDSLVKTKTANWRNTLVSSGILDVIDFCMIKSISTKYKSITENIISTMHPYGRRCPDGI